jgi:hypothetical protein
MSEIIDDTAEADAVRPSPAPRSTRQPSTKFAEKAPVTDPEATLAEQLRDDRYTQLRTDMGLEYVDSLAIPDYGDRWIPGYKTIPVGLAREFGLSALGDDDPLDEIPIDEPIPTPVGAVDGNLVESFVDGLKGQHLFDVLNATLLAQLAANVKYDRESEPVPWTKYYTRVLENVGWVVPEFSFFGLRSSQTRFSMHSALLKVIQAIMTQRQVDIVTSSLQALEELNGGDRRLTIFRRNSAQNNAGNFQVDAVGQSAANIVSMKLCAFHFKTDESVTDVLWFRFNSGSTTLNATRTTLVLNEQVYSRLREAILTKLGNRGLDYIGGLDIG